MRNRPLRAIVAACVALAAMGQAVRAITGTAPQGEGEPAIPGAATTVSITDGGFVPSVVTITLGSAVVWINHTSEPGHLAYGDPKRTLTPLTSGNSTGLDFVAAPNAPEEVAQRSAPA